jgi:hypothetical protein
MSNEKRPEEIQEEYERGNKVLKKGEKYYCSECHSEVPIKKTCSVCKKEIDWDRVFLESRR